MVSESTLKAAPVGTCDKRGRLFADTGIKLGIFGFNVSSAGVISKSPTRYEISWHDNLRIAQLADAAGIEAVIPFSRWRGLEGVTNPWGCSFDTYVWAAGIAAATSRIVTFATSHALTISPVIAAKQIATIDHIGSGRVALNVVAGWAEKEMQMLGVGHLDHDERYQYLEDWMNALYLLWSEQTDFDYEGKYVILKSGFSEPAPVQTPRPPVMNAAFSPRGQEFAAQYADIAFAAAHDIEGARAGAEAVRKLASSHGRDVRVWMGASVVLADTDREAQETVRRLIDEADGPAVENYLTWTMGGTRMSPEVRQHMSDLSAATPGLPLVGTASAIADQIAAIHDAGVDGLALSWADPGSGVEPFIAEVLPELERNGARKRASVASSAAGASE